MEGIEADTGETPDPLRERPDLDLPGYLGDVLAAFWDLNAARQFDSNGIAYGITASDVLAYVTLHGGHYDPPWFFRMIRAADEACLSYLAERRDKVRKARKPPPRR